MGVTEKMFEAFVGLSVEEGTAVRDAAKAGEKAGKAFGQSAQGAAGKVTPQANGGGGGGSGGGAGSGGSSAGFGSGGFLGGLGLIEAFRGVAGLIGRGVETYAAEVKYRESQFDLINSQLSASDSAALKRAHENSKRLANEIRDAEQVDSVLNAGMGPIGPGSAFRAIKNYFAPAYAPSLETGRRAAELKEQQQVERDILKNATIRRDIFNERVSANTTSASLDSIAFDIQQFVRMNTMLGRK